MPTAGDPPPEVTDAVGRCPPSAEPTRGTAGQYAGAQLLALILLLVVALPLLPLLMLIVLWIRLADRRHARSAGPRPADT